MIKRRSTKQRICGTIMPTNDKRIGGPRHVCTKPSGHEGSHGDWKWMLQVEHAKAMQGE